MRRILAVLAICMVLYGISESPHRWATAVGADGSKIADVASGFGTFFTDVVS